MKVIDRYQLEEVVGAGNYGKVYRSTTTDTGEVFAIKVIPMEKFKKIKKLNEFTENEIAVLESIQHPNIVKYVEKLITMNNTYMVYEFCNNGTLESKIYADNHLSEQKALKYFSEILSALCLLNRFKVLHRDIKPQNIMLNNDDIKIGDFGFCKPMRKFDFSQTMVGSPIYMAPEILKNQSYDDKADVWSMGVCLFEMLFGRCPFEEKTIPALIALFDRQSLQIPREINNISIETENLLRMLLVVNPSGRANFKQAQEYLTGYYPYAKELKMKYNDIDPSLDLFVRKPVKNLIGKEYESNHSYNPKTIQRAQTYNEPPKIQNYAPTSARTINNYATNYNRTYQPAPVAKYQTNNPTDQIYNKIPDNVFNKQRNKQVDVIDRSKGVYKPIRTDNIESKPKKKKRPVSPLKFNTMKALNLNTKKPVSIQTIKNKTPIARGDTANNTVNMVKRREIRQTRQRRTMDESNTPSFLPDFLLKFNNLSSKTSYSKSFLSW